MISNLLAQGSLNEIQGEGFKNSTPKFLVGNTTIGSIVSAAIPWIFTIAGMLLLVYLIFGGLQLMLAQGDPKNTQAAKSHITNALVGFIIVFLAYFIVQLVGSILYLPRITTIFR